jgi:aspartate aminotransferase-like enzyme
MISFAAGPVMMSSDVKAVGAEDIPYFRTKEFGKMMLDNERMIKEFLFAPADARVAFLTASGTGAMECALINTLTPADKVLVINGGTFGERWADLCKIHSVPFQEIKLKPGQSLKQHDLSPYNGQGFTALLIQAHETSTGVKYDLPMVSQFCKANHLFWIIDAVSAFLCDPIDMKTLGANLVLTSSQKGLATAPGVSLLCLDQEAVQRANKINVPFTYFNLPLYLKNMERGQTPFTPACSVMKQINVRLHDIEKKGVQAEIDRVSELALYFRSQLKEKHLPLTPLAETPSNAVTSLCPSSKIKAHDLFELIYQRYDIFVCPNGGSLSDTVFRVGHMGNLTKKDYDKLIACFVDLQKENLI